MLTEAHNYPVDATVLTTGCVQIDRVRDLSTHPELYAMLQGLGLSGKNDIFGITNEVFLEECGAPDDFLRRLGSIGLQQEVLGGGGFNTSTNYAHFRKPEGHRWFEVTDSILVGAQGIEERVKTSFKRYRGIGEPDVTGAVHGGYTDVYTGEEDRIMLVNRPVLSLEQTRDIIHKFDSLKYRPDIIHATSHGGPVEIIAAAGRKTDYFVWDPGKSEMQHHDFKEVLSAVQPKVLKLSLDEAHLALGRADVIDEKDVISVIEEITSNLPNTALLLTNGNRGFWLASNNTGIAFSKSPTLDRVVNTGGAGDVSGVTAAAVLYLDGTFEGIASLLPDITATVIRNTQAPLGQDIYFEEPKKHMDGLIPHLPHDPALSLSPPLTWIKKNQAA